MRWPSSRPARTRAITTSPLQESWRKRNESEISNLTRSAHSVGVLFRPETRVCETKELPNLKELYSEFHAEGLEIVGIGLDAQGRLDTARAFIQENDLPWMLSLSGRAYEDEVASLYQVNGLPSIWLVDRDGVLQHQDLHGEELRTAVEQMINHTVD